VFLTYEGDIKRLKERAEKFQSRNIELELQQDILSEQLQQKGVRSRGDSSDAFKSVAGSRDDTRVATTAGTIEDGVRRNDGRFAPHLMTFLESHSLGRGADLDLEDASEGSIDRSCVAAGGGSDSSSAALRYNYTGGGVGSFTNGPEKRGIVQTTKEARRLAKEYRKRLKTYQRRIQDLEAENAEFHKQRRQYMRQKQFAVSMQNKLDALAQANDWLQGELTTLRLENARVEARTVAAKNAAATAEAAEARLRHEREALLEEVHLMRHSTQEAELHRTRASLLRRFMDKHAGGGGCTDYTLPSTVDISTSDGRARGHGISSRRHYTKFLKEATSAGVVLNNGGVVSPHGAATRVAATADRSELNKLLDQVDNRVATVWEYETSAQRLVTAPRFLLLLFTSARSYTTKMFACCSNLSKL
jgi:hypothetical protein